MSLTCYSDRETEILLSGMLPHAAVVLYVWLRSRMSWNDGRVGQHADARINWQAITEALYVEYRPGPSNSGACSYETARGVARHLVRSGLVRMLSDSARRHLIFECVFAPRTRAPENQPHSEKQPQPHSEKRGGTQRETHQRPPAQPHSEKRAQPHRHLDLVSTGVHQDARASNSAVDNRHASELFFPPLCSSRMNRALGALIEKSNSNGSAQPMLDELAARMERRNPPIEKPARYLAKLIAANARGDFSPSNAALNVAQRRTDAQQKQCNIGAPHKPTTAGRELAREAIALARKKKLH